jgi:serine/threonine-protein kinase
MSLDPQAVAAARSLARLVVNAGLAKTDPVRKAYFEFVEAGCPGMFGDHLVKRGLVSVDALAALPEPDGPQDDRSETGRFPRPTPSGRFPAAAKKKKASSRLVPQSGMDLLTESQEAAQLPPAPLDPRIPAGWDQIQVTEEGSGLSILTELEDEGVAEKARSNRPPPQPHRGPGPSPGASKLKATPQPQSLPPVPSAAALPQVEVTQPKPQPQSLSVELSGTESALGLVTAPPGSGPSFDDLALNIDQVKATRSVKRPNHAEAAPPGAAAAVESPQELPPNPVAQATGPSLEASMDELSFGAAAAQGAGPSLEASMDELSFGAAAAQGAGPSLEASMDELSFGAAAAQGAGSVMDASALEAAVASGRSLDELGFDINAITAQAGAAPADAAPASPWGAPAAATPASPWGAPAAGAPAEAAPVASPWGAAVADTPTQPTAAAPAVTPQHEPAATPQAQPAATPPASAEDENPLANLEVSGDHEAGFSPPARDDKRGAAASKSGDGSPASDEDDLQVGQTLGDYELVEELGRGGMGIVFKALRKGSVHHYAIKTLKPGTGPVAQKRRRRFEREVEIMRQLDHNNLVRIYDSGREGLYDWYSMDYVQGTELAQMLAEYRLSPDEKLQVFDQVCQAIAHAHERGVVHRDLKPANILVGDELQVRVLDFGLAKIERETEDHNLTQAGTALGTPYYMSPEQILSPTDVGPEADVWSSGVMLYEMMTGRRPFVGQTAGEIANQILNHEPTPPKKINNFVHDDIQNICLKALEKDTSVRYKSAEEMLADMRRHRRGKGVKGASSFRGVSRWLQQNKQPFLAGAGVASAIWAAVLAYLQLLA